MAATRQGGAGIGLPLSNPVQAPVVAGVPAGFVDLPCGPTTLAAGQVQVIPAGNWYIQLGAYTLLQIKDPRTQSWRTVDNSAGGVQAIVSDGGNVRLANSSGCVVGAFITNVGSGYTSAPVVAASAGNSTYLAIVGGAINATVTLTTAGVGYNLPPTLVVSAPPVGGVQATAVAAVSGGAISGVTVVNQGAGYLVAPTITIIPNPLDVITTQAALTVNATLVGAGTITAVICTNPGLPQTSVPTLSFTGGGGASAAATAVMCFTATGITVTAGGAVYGNAQPFGVITVGGIVPGTAGATVNPALALNTFIPRQACLAGVSTAGGAITATGLVICDGGLFQAIPTAVILPGGSGLPTTIGQATINVGGVSDTTFIYPY